MARKANARAARRRGNVAPAMRSAGSTSGFSAPNRRLAGRAAPGRDLTHPPRLRRDIMHPMFKELFIDTDVDDLAAEDDQRRARRSRRARQVMITRPAAGNRRNQPP